MSWYKKAKSLAKIKDHFEKILGLGKYRPDPITKKRKKRIPREPYHSLDMGEFEGDNDGY